MVLNMSRLAIAILSTENILSNLEKIWLKINADISGLYFDNNLNKSK